MAPFYLQAGHRQHSKHMEAKLQPLALTLAVMMPACPAAAADCLIGADMCTQAPVHAVRPRTCDRALLLMSESPSSCESPSEWYFFLRARAARS